MKADPTTYIRPAPTDPTYSPPTVLVDMDGVLANYEAELNRRWQERHPDIKLTSRHDRKYHSLVDEHPELEEKIWAITSEEDFFYELPAIEGAIEGLLALDEHYKGNVRICTAPSIHNTQCVPGKYSWVGRHLGIDWMRKTHFDKDKTYARGTYLIDDKPHITGGITPEWKHIRYAQPYNQGTSPRITWKEVIAAKGDLEAVLEQQRMNSLQPVICVDWEESERGWGTRPDGISLHHTQEDAERYINQYWSQMPAQVPDEYERPVGRPNTVYVTPEILEEIQKKEFGERYWRHEERELLQQKKLIKQQL